MDGNAVIFIRKLTTRAGQLLYSKFLMETALGVSQCSHGIKKVMVANMRSAMTTHICLIYLVADTFPPLNLALIFSVTRTVDHNLAQVKN